MICAIDECTEASHARGWCKPHYDRFRRTGNPIRCADERKADEAARVDALLDRLKCVVMVDDDYVAQKEKKVMPAGLVDICTGICMGVWTDAAANQEVLRANHPELSALLTRRGPPSFFAGLRRDDTKGALPEHARLAIPSR